MSEKSGANYVFSDISVANLILDQVNALIYVCRIDTFEILYMNKYARALYGDGVGKTCWHWLQKGINEPCTYCAINFLNADKSEDITYIRDRYNPVDDKWYEVHDSLIEWPNTGKVKLQIAYNIDLRKKDEKKFRQLHKQQELFAQIANTFNKEIAFANKMNEVLNYVGNYIHVCRVSLFENLYQKRYPTLSYEYCAKGIKPKLNRVRELVFDQTEAYYTRIEGKSFINIEDLSLAKYRGIFSVFQKFGVQALLLLPLYLHENHIGYLSFEDCRVKRNWKKDEIKLLKTFSNIIATSLERKRIEEARIRTEWNLRKANATKDKFFSVISRDMHAPFSSLISLSGMLLENYSKWPDQKRILFIDSIRESSKQGFKLLENLIIWSKIQSGSIEFYPTDIDIRSAIHLAVEQLTEAANQKKITITGVPQEIIFAYADYHMIHRTIINLLGNAIKFTPENGKILIDLHKNDEFVEVAIHDNGIGIEKAYISSLFKIDRFSSEFSPTEEKGTGLGLIICREFVEKNRGKIWAESKLGQGSCFKFTIPLTK
jgi:signal transduction histidine kinase